ncbi:MAG: hypothetical protein C4536_09535 [Actinobacteria bacterium]|jgi:hypothetical protein|nr:MAG: hypothetical protein C4536_09535 [Actinomycetota bacterium]
MNQIEILLQTAERLNSMRIPYMVTGAFAVTYYGKPRSTHDIDLIVEIDMSDTESLHEVFYKDFYASKEAMEEAVRHHSMFNLIHNETLTKIDFWMLEDTVFDRERFSRRVEGELRGAPVFFSSPEDIVIVKLDWFKKTGIHKHYEDALGIVLVQQDSLDFEYVRDWCERGSTSELLERLLGEAG